MPLVVAWREYEQALWACKAVPGVDRLMLRIPRTVKKEGGARSAA